jgi:dynein heavy chain 1
MLKISIYGNRIDNTFDQRMLEDLVDRIFVPESFSLHFPLARVPDNEGGFVEGTDVVLTDGTKRQQFVEWVDALPASNPPTWLGLPDTAEVRFHTMNAYVTLYRGPVMVYIMWFVYGLFGGM